MLRTGVRNVLKRNTPTKVKYFRLVAVLLCGMPFLSCDTGYTKATITAEEFRFTPNLVKLPARQIVRLIVRNQGRERHVFQSPILTRKDVLISRNSLTREAKGTDGISIQPGEQIELSFVLPQGLYPFRCRIKGHKGMEGTLVVVK